MRGVCVLRPRGYADGADVEGPKSLGSSWRSEAAGGSVCVGDGLATGSCISPGLSGEIEIGICLFGDHGGRHGLDHAFVRVSAV